MPGLRNKLLFLFAFAIILPAQLSECFAQSIPGYNVSNYAGISGIDLQSASIADSRYKFDAAIIGGGFTIANNFLTVRRDGVLQRKLWRDSVNDIKQTYFNEIQNNNRKGAYLNAYLQGASFMYSFNQNFSLAFTFNIRNYTNADNINPELATLIYNEFNAPGIYNLRLNNDRFSVSSLTWAEYGIGFGQVVRNRGSSFLKIGGRVKVLQGIAAGYLYARNLNYRLDARDTLSLFQSDFGYGHSDNFEIGGTGFKLNNFVTGPSFGLDLGVVYEYRPEEASFYGPDAQPRPGRRDLNKYKLRIGASLIDVGSIRFRRGNFSGDFRADVQYWDINNIDVSNRPIQTLDDTLRRRFGLDDSRNTFSMALPTALSLQIDYHIANDFYANFTAYISPRFHFDESKVHGMDYFALAPRWDHKWFGAFLPVSINTYGQLNTGLALRAGPLVIGTSDISPLLWTQHMKSVDLHAALKLPIPFGKPGTNSKDECPAACPEPGSSVFMKDVDSLWQKIRNFFKRKK